MLKKLTKEDPIAEAVLEAIKAGHNTAKMIGEETGVNTVISAEARKTGRNKMRILDATLQRLRRNGFTEFKQGAWFVKLALDL